MQKDAYVRVGFIASYCRSASTMNEERCPACGAPDVGGREGCQALYEAFGFQTYSDRRLAAVHLLSFDAYCMQHVETYCVSAKSYAAHLTRLCCGIEHGGNPVIYATINRWLNGKVELEKPPLLSQRGEMTLVDVRAAPGVEAQVKKVQEWANNVWVAYAPQQELARQWIKAALARR